MPITLCGPAAIGTRTGHSRIYQDDDRCAFATGRSRATTKLRKIIKTRRHFPSDDAANKLIWLALRNITADWGRVAHDWKSAMNQFAILYAERFTRAAA